jgi:hypothetical protein
MQHQCRITIKPGPHGCPRIVSAEGTLPANATVTVSFAEDAEGAEGGLVVLNDVVIDISQRVPVAVPV